MSIVVAIRKNDRTVLAADSLTVFGDGETMSAANSSSRKIARLGSSVVGAAGWGVYDDILAHFLKDRAEPDFSSSANIFEFFLELWKALHETYPFVNDQAGGKDSPFGDLDSTFLIGNATGIYKVANDLGVTPFNAYYAVGSGSEYALGAIQAMYDMDLDAATIARKAVEAACTFDVHCGGEVDVLMV
ncbi:MAG: hypothetical protein KC983_10280 [Phycisphaerales bacterium]|nr:hypothetical protein [Phycisphaerales bacterium]